MNATKKTSSHYNPFSSVISQNLGRSREVGNYQYFVVHYIHRILNITSYWLSVKMVLFSYFLIVYPGIVINHVLTKKPTTLDLSSSIKRFTTSFICSTCVKSQNGDTVRGPFIEDRTTNVNFQKFPFLKTLASMTYLLKIKKWTFV